MTIEQFKEKYRKLWLEFQKDNPDWSMILMAISHKEDGTINDVSVDGDGCPVCFNTVFN